MGVELDEGEGPVALGMGPEEGVGDEVVAAEGDEARAASDDLPRLRGDRCGNRRRPAVVERAVAVVDHGEGGERVDAERILRIAVEDRRGTPDRLRPEAGARPVGDGAVEGDAEDHRIDPGELPAVAPAHEGQRPAIGRLERAAEERPEEGVVGWPGMAGIGHAKDVA